MKQYHKIQTVFLRDPKTKFKTLLQGKFALPEFEFLASNEWVFTEKVDGTNIRIIFDGKRMSFAGKSDRAQIPAPLLARLEERFKPMEPLFAEKFPDGVCLYGEGYGMKIQKVGRLYRDDQDFVLFDARVGDWWLQRESVEQISAELKLDIVPIIGSGSLHDMVRLTRQGFDSLWGNFRAEGIVARPALELTTRDGSRIITKLKHKDFRPPGK